MRIIIAIAFVFNISISNAQHKQYVKCVSDCKLLAYKDSLANYKWKKEWNRFAYQRLNSVKNLGEFIAVSDSLGLVGANKMSPDKSIKNLFKEQGDLKRLYEEYTFLFGSDEYTLTRKVYFDVIPPPKLEVVYIPKQKKKLQSKIEPPKKTKTKVYITQASGKISVDSTRVFKYK